MLPDLPNGVLREKDIDYVLKRFEEEVWKSLILRRITLDTSAATVDETFKEFLRQMAPHFTEKDRLALLTHQRLMGADCGSG